VPNSAVAKESTIEFDKKKEYVARLTGEQLKLLLNTIYKTAFPGEMAFAVGDTISALQKPLLEDAHGAKEDDGEDHDS
jgi:hypothetical protein